ncbi:MAG TPA: STAS domain-containing protein [Candidatus Kapabacteria bacterium]|nr:STAS domain-containing protein [Candidatus Kapabacteria bacterium]HPP38997.1 STAS domain-containing protein [Candidatus Kapabacteria bacterium]
MNNSNFKIEKKKIDDLAVLSISGYLDAHTSPLLEQELEKSVKDGCYKIIVNFSDLDYISSAGLGVFMAFIEDVRQNGGDIKLTNMKEKVFAVFDLLGFPLLFDILNEEDEAITKFQGN